MGRYAIEHLPRAAARYRVTSMSYSEARQWMAEPGYISLVRTTELIDAIENGFGVRLEQSERSMELHPGDEALLVCLSFGVLLAFAEGDIAPLPEDWRCSLLVVERPDEVPEEAPVLAVADPLEEAATE
jgi:hypothetical protein